MTQTKTKRTRKPPTVPDAERAWVTGLLEWSLDDAHRARTYCNAVAHEALTDEGASVVAAVLSQLLASDDPLTMTDITHGVREFAGDVPATATDAARVLLREAVQRIKDSRAAYRIQIDKYAADITAAYRRRKLLEAGSKAFDAAGMAADGQTDHAVALEVVSQLQGLLEGDREPSDENEADGWQPFPIDQLPKVVAGYVEDAAASIGGDPAMVALPMLSSLAAAIGTTYGIELKRNWVEPSVVWSMVVGESGSSKSPSYRAALSFSNDLDRENAAVNAQARAAHHAEKLRYKAALSSWNAASKKSPELAGDPPPEPQAPADIAYVVSDTTIEALVHKLSANSRGLLMARDELSGWLASFDRYSGGAGGVSSDAAQWLELYNAGRVVVDRRYAGRIEVSQGAVSIAGGIQPQTLVKALGGQHVDNGLLARFVLAMPPAMPISWSEDEPSVFVVQGMRELLASLYAIPLGEKQRVCRMTAEAKAIWVPFFNAHHESKQGETGHVASMMTKTLALAARLALICHVVRNATVAPTLQDEIDADDIERGIAMARWFSYEWRRVYRVLVGAGTASEKPEETLVSWLKRQGGEAAVRTISSSGLRRFRNKAEHVERIVGQLVREGRLQSFSRPNENGGPPAHWVRLAS